MTEPGQPKQYNLEERTLKFSRDVIEFTNGLKPALANIEITKQLIRSACSVGANYIEANESLSKKDFSMRAKICRKEAKESKYWLSLIQANGDGSENTRLSLLGEADELTRIFAATVEKSK